MNMTEEQIMHELRLMEQAGLTVVRSDTRVPLVDVPVQAGTPREAGDATPGQYLMLPRELVGRHPMFVIDVEGDSMRDAGIMPGDRLEVEMDSQAADGDIVVAEVEGSYTVKTLFTDDEGLLWLVPRNADYDAICLTNRQWRIVGRVTGLRKAIPRTTYGDCAKAVMRTRRKGLAPQDVAETPDMPQLLVVRTFHNRRRIDYATIRARMQQVLVAQMRYRYEWYAAYRVMLDLGLLDELQLSKFAQQMQAWFPDAHLRCTADCLGDYAIGHTSKAFTLWNGDAFRADMRKNQSVQGFNTLYHRCQELRAAIFPLPLIELRLPF